MSDYALSGDFGDQLSMDEGVPQGGETYRHSGVGSIACVLGVSVDRRALVRLRVDGEEREVPLDRFLEQYRRCRVDGSLL
jgi:hypothetical protein